MLIYTAKEGATAWHKFILLKDCTDRVLVNVEQKTEINHKQGEQNKDVEPGGQQQSPHELNANKRKNNPFYGIADFPPPFIHRCFTPIPSFLRIRRTLLEVKRTLCKRKLFLRAESVQLGRRLILSLLLPYVGSPELLLISVYEPSSVGYADAIPSYFAGRNAVYGL